MYKSVIRNAETCAVTDFVTDGKMATCDNLRKYLSPWTARHQAQKAHHAACDPLEPCPVYSLDMACCVNLASLSTLARSRKVGGGKL